MKYNRLSDKREALKVFVYVYGYSFTVGRKLKWNFSGLYRAIL